MKVSQLIMAASVAGMFMIAAPAFAADAAAAKAAPSAAPGVGEKWTEADVKRLCTNRFPNKPKRYAICLDKNKGHIGQVKDANDVKMIETGVNPRAHAKKMSKAPAKTKS